MHIISSTSVGPETAKGFQVGYPNGIIHFPDFSSVEYNITPSDITV